ncbi:alpha-L-glutamate ligase [Alphaproteobacteria bacterium]|nr:alpha-L-glutamate ligase [Alphaproteobacteria bacterium]
MKSQLKSYIIHENEEWLIPLRKALEKFDVQYEEWLLDDMTINIDQSPPNGIFFSRMSASNYTRNHLHSNQSSNIILTWLENHNRRVINGTNVLKIEFSKVLQQLLLKQSGFKTPKTIVAVGINKIKEAASNLNVYPMIIKPNQGGKGFGVKLINTINELDEMLEDNLINSSKDDTWLLQEKISTNEEFITRMEFIGGNFIYSLKVFSKNSFELCPADACEVDLDQFCPVDEINDINNSQPSFFIDDDPDKNLAKQLTIFLKKHQIEVAGVEFIRNKDGVPIFYDINTNTNYNLNAEKQSKVNKNGMEEIALFLKSELDKISI